MYKLLIVEDEQLTRNFLKQIIPNLSDEWEIIDDVMDGKDALEVLAKEHVDLVLTDIKMPVMDGIELCRHINESYPQTHCAILSGYGEFNYAKSAINYNVNSYLLKPIVNEELKNMLESIGNLCNKNECDKKKYNELVIASNKYQESIIARFLKAVVTGSHMEIQSLYPILHNLKINLFDTEGIILVLQITEDILIKNDIKISDIILLKLLLYNTAKKQVANTSVQVFIDADENTILLVPIEENKSTDNLIYQICSMIDVAYYQETKLHVFTSAGSSENELLQLDISYDNACKAFLQSLFNKNEVNTIQLYSHEAYEKQIDIFNSYILNLTYAIQNDDTVNLEVISQDISHLLYGSVNNSFILKAINYIIHKLKTNIKLNEDATSKIYKSLVDSKDSLTTANNIKSFLLNISNIIIDNIHINNSSCDENSLIEKTKEFIYQHYMEPISLALIADKLCISYAYLSNLFHEMEGKSYIKFLTEVRLKHAANLLKNNDLKLDYITKKVGYISVKHFSYVFKKYYGVTPGEYRKRK